MGVDLWSGGLGPKSQRKSGRSRGERFGTLE